MKQRPLLVATDLINPIINGDKTQTRRVIKHIPALGMPLDWCPKWIRDPIGMRKIIGDPELYCPYGKVGDQLWVREAFYAEEHQVYYKADGDCCHSFPDCDCWGSWGKKPKWRPSIHMPRDYCRIILEITEIRIERLQDISAEDAVAEGIHEYHGEQTYKIYTPTTSFGTSDPIRSFRSLIETVQGPKVWIENPWVWVIGFKVVEYAS